MTKIAANRNDIKILNRKSLSEYFFINHKTVIDKLCHYSNYKGFDNSNSRRLVKQIKIEEKISLNQLLIELKL